MKALVLETLHQAPVYKEVEKPAPKTGEVLVKIHAAALNHRDVYISKGQYAKIITPIILGSDGSGVVVELGSDVDKSWLGKAVIINPSIDWGDNPKVQGKNYNILGMPSNGCFAEYVCVPANRLAEKPAQLSFEQAASIPLAGLTGYRALFTRGALQAGEKLLISGIGGGVALIALQMAVAVGAEVWVTSGSQDKIDAAIALGAKGGINYKAEDWAKQLKTAASGFDLILDSAGGPGFKHFLDLANMAGRIVFYGGTHGNFEVNPQKMFWKQLSIMGSTMGNDDDFEAMLALFNKHNIIPTVHQSWPLEQGAAAFEFMEAGKQLGKIILTTA
jgi:zinc-binding alcohol dehydrogenase/oxidoreductase